MFIRSLKKSSAIQLCLMETNINTIKKCVPPELYEYYLAIKNCYSKCRYCKKYFLNVDIFSFDIKYCSYKCCKAYDKLLYK